MAGRAFGNVDCFPYAAPTRIFQTASNHLSAFRLAVVRPCRRLLDAVDQLLHAVPIFAVAVYSRA